MKKIQAFINEQIDRNNEKFFLWSPFFFALGIALYFYLPAEPVLSTFIYPVIGMIIGCIWLNYKKYQSYSLYLFYLLFLALTLMAVGFTVAKIKAEIAYTPMLVKKISPVMVEGDIEKLEFISKKEGSRAVLSNLNIERLAPANTPRKIRLKIRQNDGLALGQRIRILAGLNPASPPNIAKGFDFQRMMYFRGIGGVGFAYNPPEIISNHSAKIGLMVKIQRHIAERVDLLSKYPQQGAIIKALMTGQREAISDEDWQALRDSGLAHLLAISGLHVGMVAGVLFFFSRLFMACIPRLALYYPIKKWAAIIALLGAMFYTVLVGATVPTQRALIMTALVMVAIILDRSAISLRLVGLAALLVLFFSPQSLLSVSFQMSFAAVLSLIYFYSIIRPWWSQQYRQVGIIRKLSLYFVGVSLTTIIAGFATGIFALYHFQNFAAYGVLSNLVAVPIMGVLVMPFIVLNYFLIPLGLDFLIMPVIEWGVSWILASAHWVANLEGAVWHMASFPSWVFYGILLGLWFALIVEGRVRYIGLIMSLLFILLIPFQKNADVMIAPSFDLIAVRDDLNRLWFSTLQKERFVSDNWQRLNGGADDKKLRWFKEGEHDLFPLQCDANGCRGNINQQKISFAFKPEAWREDCHWADIVISNKSIDKGQCDAPVMIDYFDVWRHGGHSIWLSKAGVRIQAVEMKRGNRLWTQTAYKNKVDD